MPVVSVAALEQWLAYTLAEGNIMRAKGVVAVDGSPRRVLVQAVNDMFDTAETTLWGDDDLRVTRLVLIGRSLEADQLKASFVKACAGLDFLAENGSE